MLLVGKHTVRSFWQHRCHIPCHLADCTSSCDSTKPGTKPQGLNKVQPWKLALVPSQHVASTCIHNPHASHPAATSSRPEPVHVALLSPQTSSAGQLCLVERAIALLLCNGLPLPAVRTATRCNLCAARPLHSSQPCCRNHPPSLPRRPRTTNPISLHFRRFAAPAPLGPPLRLRVRSSSLSSFSLRLSSLAGWGRRGTGHSSKHVNHGGRSQVTQQCTCERHARSRSSTIEHIARANLSCVVYGDRITASSGWTQ